MYFDLLTNTYRETNLLELNNSNYKYDGGTNRSGGSLTSISSLMFCLSQPLVIQNKFIKITTIKYNKNSRIKIPAHFNREMMNRVPIKL